MKKSEIRKIIRSQIKRALKQSFDQIPPDELQGRARGFMFDVLVSDLNNLKHNIDDKYKSQYKLFIDDIRQQWGIEYPSIEYSQLDKELKKYFKNIVEQIEKLLDSGIGI